MAKVGCLLPAESYGKRIVACLPVSRDVLKVPRNDKIAVSAKTQQGNNEDLGTLAQFEKTISRLRQPAHDRNQSYDPGVCYQPRPPASFERGVNDKPNNSTCRND